MERTLLDPFAGDILVTYTYVHSASIGNIRVGNSVRARMNNFKIVTKVFPSLDKSFSLLLTDIVNLTF